MAHLESIMGHGTGSINPFAQMPGMSDRNLNDPEAINSLLQDPEVISRTMSMMSPEMIDAVRSERCSFVRTLIKRVCRVLSPINFSPRNMDDETFFLFLLVFTLTQAIAANPQLAPMGPQLREMMTSPFFRQMMSNPEMVRSLMQMRGGAGGMPGMPGLPGMGNAAAGGFPAPGSYEGQNNTSESSNTASGSTAGANPAPANPFASLFGGGAPPMGGGANPFGMDPAMLQSLLGGAAPGGFGGFGSPSAAPAAPQDTRPLEERYQSQLLQLNEMGLCDPGQNIRALSMTGGNVNAAVELIFSGRESFLFTSNMDWMCAERIG